MTLFNSRGLPVLLCLALVGFAGASYGTVRFDVVPSPTEVINTGRSEVTGSVNLIVRGTGNVTGTSTGGFAQIGLLYTNPSMRIDNTTSTGIQIYYSSGFIAANPTILEVGNVDINGQLTGNITINLEPGATPVEGDFIRIEGVRGQIDRSVAITPGTNLFVQLQSINDPTANSFTPDTARVATSFDGMHVDVQDDSILLCFPTLGKTDDEVPSYYIEISEGFVRAFVDEDANNDGNLMFDRVDSGAGTVAGVSSALGDPTVSTHFLVMLDDVPSSVTAVDWPEFVWNEDQGVGSTSFLFLEDSEYDEDLGVSTGIYSYQTENQTDYSDIELETFRIRPVLELGENQTETGTVLAAATLYPTPTSSSNRPRFRTMFESDDDALNAPQDDPFLPYASIIRCNCFLLFTYVTTEMGYNTGVAIANTTGDTSPFGESNEAPDQLGKITFYFYDKDEGYVGFSRLEDDVLPGHSFVSLFSEILPEDVDSFSGYVIARAEFQFCHGFAFIADEDFGTLSHGYIANVIPDPAIQNQNGRRAAIAAGDPSRLPAGESLNN